MDMRQWDVHQLNSSVNRYHPRDVESTSIEAITTGSGRSNRLGQREPFEAADWKRRAHSSQTQAGIEWETSVQTSLWLAQQNSLTPIASMSRDETGQSSQAVESEQAFSSDELMNQVRNWPRDNESGDVVHVLEGSGSGARESSVSANPNKFSTRAHLPTQISPARKDVQETAAPQPRKPANIADIEHQCEKCAQAEPRWRESAATLSKLAESFFSGTMAEVIAQARRDGILHDRIPYIPEIHQIFDLIQQTSELAMLVVRGAPSYLQNTGKETPFQANDLQSSLETMKRRFLTDSQEVLKRQRRHSSDVNSSHEPHDYSPLAHDPTALGESPRRSSTVDVVTSDVLPPIRSHSPSRPSIDGYGTTLPSMKPPPTPGRQLPSPPGRSHPSPPCYNIPSPSSLLYPQSVASTNAQPPQSSVPNILHPLSPTPSSSLGTTTAIQAHTAALQHEVSIKKYALQTLQSEHDKLLAALRRSQTRSRALEEKQVASDLEINTLAEERVRLLTQVQELEQNIADVSKSRDDFRQAAVKGGAQYVKIVRMASQLEMMAGEERIEWKRKLDEKTQTIDSLNEALRLGRDAPVPPDDITGAPGDLQAVASSGGSSVEDLKKEVQRLRIRCAEIETVLRSIRSESYRFGEAVATLSSAGELIFHSAGGVLADALMPAPVPPIETALPPGEMSDDRKV